MNKETAFSLIFFGEGWTDMWPRRQQLAFRLANSQAVDKVIYVEQPLTLTSLAKYLIKKGTYSARTGWKRVLRHRSLVQRVSDNIYLITPITPLPWTRSKVLTALDSRFRFRIQAYLIKRLLASLKLQNTVLWVGLPYIPRGLLHQFNQRLTWYDYTDDYSVFHFMPASFRELATANNDYLLDYSDIVSVVSKGSYVDLRDKGADKNICWLPNAVDMEPFIRPLPSEPPEDMKGIRPPRLGFVGGVGEILDLGLLEYLAESRPWWSLVLVGGVSLPQRDLSRLKRYPSIHFLGRKPYQALPHYLQHMDVCLQFCKPGALGEQSSVESTQKTFLYLAAGKPVVDFRPASEEDVNRGLVRTASTKEGFVAGIEEALANDSPALRQKRIEYAQANTWDARAQKIVDIITQALKDRG